MMFLTWLDDVFQALGKLIGDILNIIWGILCWVVYPLMSWLFSIFTRLSSADILREDIIEGIYGRVTIILTIVMTFYIVFEFVKYTVSPDTITDKDKGAMPLFVRIVLAIIMLAFVPTIFSAANDLQQKIISSNVIPRVILGTVHNDGDVYGPGREFVGDVYSAFIVVDCDEKTLVGTCEGLKEEVYRNIEGVKRGNPLHFAYSSTLTQFSQGIHFNGLLALIFGCFMVYVLFLYCKDIALRHVQLLFLQIIAPVAIISYIGPKKDGMFQKWLKQCITTYLDLFIRIAVLYFMILMCDILGDTFQLDKLQTTVDGVDKQLSLTLYLFLIAGVMMFLKKAPKLLEELFPRSGAASIGFGFSAKERRGLLNPLDVASRTAGSVAGIMTTGKAIKEGKLLDPKTLEKFAGKKGGKIAAGAYKAATYTDAIFQSGKSGFQAGKDGKFGEAIRAGQSKVHDYEQLVQAGGTVLGHDLLGGFYHNLQAGIKLDIDEMQNKVKDNETKSNLAKVVKTAQDAAEDRSRKKIEAHEQKIKVEAADAKDLMERIGTSEMAKYGISISGGEKTSDVYAMFEAKANSARAVATAMNQEMVAATIRRSTAIQEKDMIATALTAAQNSASEAQSRVNSTVAGTAEHEKARKDLEQFNQEIARLEAESTAKQQQIDVEDGNIVELKTQIAKNEAEEVAIKALSDRALKELERYAITRTIRGGVETDQKDEVIEQSIASARQYFDNILAQMAQDPTMDTEIRAALPIITDPETNEVIVDYYEMLKNHKSQVTKFDDLDKLQGFLSGYVADLANKNSAINEAIRRKQDEDKTRMANANSGGKK